MVKKAIFVALFLSGCLMISCLKTETLANEVDVLKYAQEAADYAGQAYVAQSQEELQEKLNEALYLIEEAEREALDIGLDAAANYAAQAAQYTLKAIEAEDLEEAKAYTQEAIAILDKVVQASQR